MVALSDINNAAADADLLARITAAAAEAGVAAPQQWAEANALRIVSQLTASGATQTLADEYAYALSTRAQAIAALPPTPGANPAAVVDAHISYAVGLIKTATGA